jgi:hypothetical protein
MVDDNNKKFGGFEVGDTGVKFQDSGWRAVKYYREATVPKIIQWTMKLPGGLIKNEKQAQYVILGFVALAIIISLFLIFGGASRLKSPKPPPGYEFSPPRPIFPR